MKENMGKKGQGRKIKKEGRESKGKKENKGKAGHEVKVKDKEE